MTKVNRTKGKGEQKRMVVAVKEDDSKSRDGMGKRRPRSSL